MIPRDELYDMYWNQEMNQYEIADVLGVSQYSIYRWMCLYNIKPRNRSESQLVGRTRLSDEDLKKMYVVNRMTLLEIANVCGVFSSTVSSWLSECGLKGARKVSRESLEQMYWVDKMSQLEMAEVIGVDNSTISDWMKEYNIKLRTSSEAMIGKTREKCGAWKGGLSFEPYCHKFNNPFKEAVRKRDDYTCQLCQYEQKLCGLKLSIHHIHYDKENCYPDVVALCRSCNSKVNSNRDYWEEHFENLLIENGFVDWIPEEAVRIIK